MKVLVTGAAGFIGSHTAERLSVQGHEVTGVDNFSPYYSTQLKEKNAALLRSKGVKMISADLRNENDYEQLTEDPDHIFHFAAHPGISKTSSFEDYLSNNIIATQKLINFARKCASLQLFTNIATSSVYGGDATKDETALPAPISDYGVTKLAAEQMVLAAARNNIFRACSLRLYSVYGPRERPDKLFTKLIKDLTIAARIGGSELSSNPRLRTALAAAKAASMPNDTIDRAIKKGAGELGGNQHSFVAGQLPQTPLRSAAAVHRGGVK